MSAAIAEKGPNELVVFKQQLDQREEQFKAALPAHIPVERFMRVVLTAVQNTPDLVNRVDRRSFFTAAIRAAQDGLLPDGREGAIIPFKGSAQWMPMVAGLRKKVRNSGEIATWDAHVVHANDAFEYELGDEPFIRHRPILDGDPGPVVAAYSVATLKTGEKSREVMTRAQLDKVRAVSRAKDSGPWKDWFEEMCRKTVARRHAKVLPMSTDMDDLIRRDDELYDFQGAREEARGEARRPKLVNALDQLAAGPRIEHAKAGTAETSAPPPPIGEAENGAGAPSTTESEQGAPAAGSSDEAEVDDGPRGELLASLRTKALDGPKRLKLALGKLTTEQVGLLTEGDFASLKAAAEAVGGGEP